jgi:hypothetical protein
VPNYLTRTRGRKSRAHLAALTLTLIAGLLSAAAASAPRTGSDGVKLSVPVTVSELPVPPTAPSDKTGACTRKINPHGTGCVSAAWGALGSPGYYWDSSYVLLGVTFAGAPATGPSSVYAGPQVLLVSTTGKKFTDGDAWKCLTCGVAAADENGIITSEFTYPPPDSFPGDNRILVGNGILSCGNYVVSDPRCRPGDTRIYPITLDGTPIGNTIGGGLTREWRLNPDGVHLGWNALVETGETYDEFAFVGRLAFDSAKSRYDLDDVTMLFNKSARDQPYVVEPGNVLRFNPRAMIGEFRGWSSNGEDALGIQSFESDNIDLWETSLATGASRPLTDGAEYTDPNFMSPNGKWLLSEQVLGSGRLGFISAMPGIPPLTDQLGTTGYVSGIRNNGNRRFFLPYLVSTGDGASEQINTAAGEDGDWNAAADPVWLASSTAVVWAENLVTSPACGGSNPLPCPVSAEPGGRDSRVMIARFPTLKASRAVPPKVVSDDIPWGTPYLAGQAFPVRPHLPAGSYTLYGTVCGVAHVVITADSSSTLITEIAVSYGNFSDDGAHTISGTERAERDADSPVSAVTWNENLHLSGKQTGTKLTSPGGFTLSPAILENIFAATGTMTTTIDGASYTQPGNGD